jgi:hypothetical protein
MFRIDYTCSSISVISGTGVEEMGIHGKIPGGLAYW